jgi:hypothetical protein
MRDRPWGITALLCLFGVGVVAAGLSAISLATPGGVLEPMWRLNPHAREGLARIGDWALVLMPAVSLACLATFVGLWRARRWGYYLAIGMLVANLIGDIVNTITGIEPRAAIGIPIVSSILWYLARSPAIRQYFSASQSTPQH